MSFESDVQAVHRSFVGLVRALGLARPDTTPCGMPMSITEAHTISELHDTGPITQQQLADRLRLKKSTVSRLIDQLVAAGTVRRVANPDDGRSVLIDLTTAGRRRALRLHDARLALFTQLIADLGPAARRDVTRALATLEDAAHALT